MAFLFAPSPEAGAHRDEEYISSLKASQLRKTKSHTIDVLSPATEGKAVEALVTVPSNPIPRRNVVFADSLAFRYLSDDHCVSVVERRRILQGYELYVVEQWACSRTSPTLVVVTYTGDEKHQIVVGSLSIPVDESRWSPRLHAYFKATRQYLARPKQTELGEILVTNLSSFPSALTVIPVPGGELREHRQNFIVNEDLKRLGCSGRSGLALTEPTEATQAKFHQLYKTSDRIPFSQSVTELVKMCQVALYMFEKLDHAYIDGLLCDITETAIGNWWTQVGAEHYNFEPTDGILGPSTVAALLGMLMGARNRLHWFGAPVSKDVFDVDSTKRGVAYFQKSNKLEKTRRLDRQTLLKLHTVTAKAAVGEGWGVQKAVKSTMADIGGKRGEMVMGMVAGKDKGGLADIETLDIDVFISLVYGERSKWLWFGKARRTFSEQPDREERHNDVSLGGVDTLQEAARRTQSMPVGEDAEPKRQDEAPGVYSGVPPDSALSVNESPGQPGDRDASRRGVFKHVAGKMSDARSGLGRIKDAVGGTRRGHASRPSTAAQDDFLDAAGTNGSAQTTTGEPTPGVGRAFTWKNRPEEYLNAIRADTSRVSLGLPSRSRETSPSGDGSRERNLTDDQKKELDSIGVEVRKDVLAEASSAVASVADETDFQGPLVEADRKSDALRIELTRRHSIGSAMPGSSYQVKESRWPRRISFGDAEEAVLVWDELIDLGGTSDDIRSAAARSEVARQLYQNIDSLARGLQPWVESKLQQVALLNDRYGRDHEEMQSTYHQLSEACQRVRYSTTELLSSERASLAESVREIEMLVARLEYEINALDAKVRDVEDGIESFEKQVEDVEKRAEVLREQLETEGWLHWLVRTLTGVGMGPNITRPRVKSN